MPGVRDGAVVVAERADQSKHLVAFYSSRQPLDIDAVKDRLAESLPEYMVPSAFHWREQPAVDGQRQDRQEKLAALAAQLSAVEDRYDAPATSTERRLAAAFPRCSASRRSRSDGATTSSTEAVRRCRRSSLRLTLDRAVSLKEVTRHPVLADLAGVVDGRSDRAIRAAAVAD